MKLDTQAKMHNLDGTEVEQIGFKTAGEVAAAVVLAPRPGMQPTEILARFKLAQKLNAGGEAEITAEEVVMIKNGAAENCTPLLAAQVILLVDPEAK